MKKTTTRIFKYDKSPGENTSATEPRTDGRRKRLAGTTINDIILKQLERLDAKMDEQNEKIDTKLDAHTETLAQIREQAIRTNGRVTTLEKESDENKGMRINIFGRLKKVEAKVGFKEEANQERHWFWGLVAQLWQPAMVTLLVILNLILLWKGHQTIPLP